MIEIDAKCIHEHSNSKVVLEEKRCKAIFLNLQEHRIAQIQVDGCIFSDKDEAMRCDWLLNIHQVTLSILVELKGCDLNRAYEQLAKTQTLLADHLHQHKAWVISYSGSPSFNTEMQQKMRRTAEKLGVRLYFKRSNATFNLPDDFLRHLTA